MMLLQTYLEVSLPPATCNARRLGYSAVHLGSTVRLGGSGARRLQHGRAGGPTPPAAAVDSPDAVQQDRLQQQQEQLPVNWAALDEELLACCGARARRWCGIQDAGVQLPAHTTVSPQQSMPPACMLAPTSAPPVQCMDLKIASSWPYMQPSWHQGLSTVLLDNG